MAGALGLLALKLSRGADLSQADRDTLEHVPHQVHRVGPRQDLIREGNRPEYVHVVLEGIACRYKSLPDGGRQIVALLLPGDFCDLRVAILGEMDHSIATLSACKIARIGRDAVERLVAGGGAVNRALWWATLVDEGVLREWMVGMGRRPADRQMAHLFCELLVRLRAVGLALEDSYELPLTQADLGDLLGLTPVHVNRVLQRLRTDGLIVLGGGRLSVPDVPRLEAFAEFDPNYLHLTPRRVEVGADDTGPKMGRVLP